MKAIVNCRIFTGTEVVENHAILVQDNKIKAITNLVPEEAEKIDLEGLNISAGFMDIQLNGGYTRYFTKNPDEETLDEMYRASCDYATPYFLPTLISSELPVIEQAVKTVGNWMRRHPHIPGMHLEGPFLNPSKHGAHRPDIIRRPTDEELDYILEIGKGIIKVMTVAPECFTDAQLDKLLDSGIILSAGHSGMNYAQATDCFNKGIHLVTHLYNAMTQMGHREPGTVGAALDHEEVFTPVILDGGHVSFAGARIAAKVKGDKFFLITDSSFLGRKTDHFDWDILHLKMVDGFYRDSAGSLAGAAISMPEAMKNAMDNMPVSMENVVAMATSSVAKALKMEEKYGYIKEGYPAIFSVFDSCFSNFRSLNL